MVAVEADPIAVLARLNPSRGWGLRISAAPRQLRLVWALRSYRHGQRISSNRSAATIELGRLQRLAQGLRLGETELLLTG